VTIETQITVAIIGVSGVLFGGMISAVFQYIITRNINHSNARKAQAETSQLYQQIADIAAERALKQEERSAKQDARISALEEALRTKDQRIDELETANLVKDGKIAGLQCEVDELRRKVATLEGEKLRPRNTRANDRPNPGEQK
jgi:septal ring factor EnvC (AmiA/AmiB activator)